MFSQFSGTRAEANSKTSDVYTLPTSPYGIAHKGVVDLQRETLPVSITTSSIYENPQISEGSESRPTAAKLTLTVTVSNLEAGVVYNLYKYNSENMIPTSNFNANSGNATSVTKITSDGVLSHYTFSETIKSDEKVFYRCVASGDSYFLQ